MDINYFLSSKEKFQKILSHLNEILDVYYEIQLDDNDTIIERHVKEYERRKYEVESIINQLQKFIYSSCEHSYIEDDIDITPDRSQQITYCIKCDHTKEY